MQHFSVWEGKKPKLFMNYTVVCKKRKAFVLYKTLSNHYHINIAFLKCTGNIVWTKSFTPNCLRKLKTGLENIFRSSDTEPSYDGWLC